MLRPASQVTGRGWIIKDERRTRERRSVFTIGHSNHPANTFLDLLGSHGVEVLADTRSHPYSRHAPHFNAHAIEALLSAGGIAYLFLGRELGGRPEGDEFYDQEGRVDYALVERSPRFLGGIHRLEREMASRRVALLCSEENPAGCHRRLLVGSVLRRRGVSVLHIRGDGGVEVEDETANGQPVLFSEAEVSPRKSTRSVSRRRRPPSSSGR